MIVERLELHDFRNYANTCLQLHSGVTAVVGRNGQGKTNLVEALAYLATLESFRGVVPEVLVRDGSDQAVVRAEIVHEDGRRVLVEAEINRSGRNRVFVNRQRLVRSRDLLGALRVTVFAPDDLALVKGGPQLRRDYLDATLTSLTPKFDGSRRDLERILRQRNTLLKQAGGRLTEDIAFTLDVWDSRLASVGDEIGLLRAGLIDELCDRVDAAYTRLAATPCRIGISYEPAWRRSGLAAALVECRADDVRRQQSTVGPHRDDVALTVDDLPARTHASQGEQRTLALAMRFAVHELVRERTGSTPVLVLDDVLSELDPQRALALIHTLPPGQVVITTASALPEGVDAAEVLHIRAGHVVDHES